jgi:REP element-mobilizing transposase RayT
MIRSEGLWMARPPRLEFAGACWYVTGRSLPRRELFRDDVDRAEFLTSLSKVVSMLRWRISTFVLLRSQYHLVLETPEPNLSRGMRQLNGVYTQYYNRRHDKSGAVFHGRYRSILVEVDAHLTSLARYVLWLPVKAGLARTPADWKWSSFDAVCGLASPPRWLDIDVLPAIFGKSRRKSREKLHEFLLKGRASGYEPSRHVRAQVFLGSEEFRRKAISSASGKAGRERATPRITGIRRPTMRGILAATSQVFDTSEGDLRRKRRGPARKAAAFVARSEGALKLPEIGRALGIREFSASHLASEGEKLYLTDIDFRRRVELIRSKLGLV